MRKLLSFAFTLISLLVIQPAIAQVGVGTTTPNSAAALDITATNRGLLLPRIALFGNNSWAPLTGSPTEGMIIYNTATAGAGSTAVSPGFYYWYQSAWKPIGQGTGTGSATFNCDSITASAGLQDLSFTNGASYTGTITVKYTNGDGGTYPAAGQMIDGLSFVRTAGTLANGSGQIVYNVSGTYTGATGSRETFVMNLPGASCSLSLPVITSYQVSNLNCQAGIPAIGTYEMGTPISGASKSITVTPLAAGPYNFTSNTFAGITFSASGTFSAGQVGSPQTIILNASGTPTSTGLKTFVVTIGSQVCTFNLTVTTAANFNCAGIVSTLPQTALISGNIYGGTVVLPYTTGTGGTYPAASMTANGLTLSKPAGTYAVGSGTITYTLSGIYAGTGGGISFTLPESGCVVATGSANFNAGSVTCGGAQAGTYTVGVPMTPSNTKIIFYTINAGGYVNASTNTLNGVTFAFSGVNNTLGSGSATLVASGTPTTAGLYTYTLTLGGQTCAFSITFGAPAGFNCANITNSFSGNLVNGSPYSATINEPYTAGNGTAYGPITLGPIDGLTLTAPSGTYAAGGGTISYTLSGTFTGTTNSLVSFQLPESGCAVSVGAATYVPVTLNCGGLQSGLFTVNTPMTAGNTKVITINVATVGGYSITSISNNVTFSATGVFSTTGIQNITLVATGTPTNSGGVTYTINLGGQTCNFTVNYTAALSVICSSISNTITSPLVSGNAYTGTVTLPYIAGNGQPYGTFVVGPTSGLSATRVPGVYQVSGGNIVYNISGTYTGATNGSVSFTLPESNCVAFLGNPEIIPGSLSCAGALSGIFQVGIAAGGNTKIISFANSATGNFSVTSTNLAGISFGINVALSTTGSQNLTLVASGTPNTFGTFTYTITIDGQSCSFAVTILPAATVNCNSIINGLPTAPLISGTSYTGTVTEPYTAGNGQAYGVTTLTSNGLTLNRVAGTYATGGGNVVYNIGGTYTGTANFVSFTLPENNCIVSSGAAVLQANSLLCASVPNGAYTVGVAMTTNNNKSVTASTIGGGPITFTTNTVNGVSFSGSNVVNANLNNVGTSITATGTPVSAGTFTYIVSGGGQTCSFPVTFTSPVVFNCTGITNSLTGPLVNGTVYSGTVTVPYTGGTGGTYAASAVGPVSGLTLSAPGGTYSTTSGTIVYTISGTYTGTTNNAAVFTLPESACTVTLGAATINNYGITCNGLLSGAYQFQVPTTAGHTKQITVDVATTGAYNFTTNLSFGFSYSASGVFTTTGPQTVTLVATGTPNSSGTTTFTVTAAGQTCSFSVPVTGSPVFNCSTITHTLPSSLTNGVAYTGTVTIPYTSSGIGSYLTTTVVVSGLTLTRVAGNYATSGSIVYNLTGTFTGTTGASVNFTLPENGCIVAAGGAVYIAASLSCGGGPSGNYNQNVPLTSANTKSVSINVTNPGAWSANTGAAVNGVIFSGSGNFGGTNSQTVILTGSGTPTSTGTFSYTVTLAGQTCSFSVTYGTFSVNCGGIVNTLPTLLVNGTTYNTGGVSIPYTSGNGSAYGVTTVTTSGLTLTRVPGTYDAGGGIVVYNLSGTYAGAAGTTATFFVEGCNVTAGNATVNQPDCSGALVGPFQVGIGTGGINTKNIDVNFVSPGLYNIFTNTVNGVSFGLSGYFTTAGVHTITLLATGVPAATGTFNYSVTVGGQTCTFQVTFSPPATFICGNITGLPVVLLATGVNYSATLTEPYTAGNGTAYATTTVNFGNISLVRTPGTFLPGGGNVIYTMSGAANTGSGLSWTLPESGCVLTLGPTTFSGSTLSCGGALAGTYTAPVPMTAANTKTVSINIIAAGAYSASTNTVNGVTFAGSGITSTLGLQDFILTATGTPTVAGTFYYTVSFGGQNCNFGVTYQ